jgi:RimJ/RimL family protein N-acetyltransferase
MHCYHRRMITGGQTRRLLLRPVELEDAEQIQALFPHWEIVRYLLNRVPWPYPADGAVRYLRDSALPAMERGEAWHWTIRLKESPGQMIGLISLLSGDRDNRGFWVGLPWQGNGYMTEACSWANDYWFETLGFPVLRVAKSAANLASRKISEKQGMRLVGTEEQDCVCGRQIAEMWELTACEWRDRKIRDVEKRQRY